MEDAKVLRARGVLVQKDPAYYTIRLPLTGGEAPAEMLSAVSAVAKRHGDGHVHLTARQCMEIPNVPAANLAAAEADLAAGGVRIGGTGALVRAVVACPGRRCRFGIIDTQSLAKMLAERLADIHTRNGRGGLPNKFKIAVTGCPNSCAKPRENDFGVAGGPGGRMVVTVGGRMGRNCRLGDELPVPISTPEELLRAAEAVIEWHCAHAEGKERLGQTIDRVGMNSLVEAVRSSL